MTAEGGDTVVVVVIPGASVTPVDIRGAADELGLRVVFVAAAGGLAGAERKFHEDCGGVLDVDPDAPLELIPALAAHAPRGIMTFSEGVVPLTACLAAGLRLPHHSASTMALLTDKWRQRARLAERGVSPVWSARVCDRGSLVRTVTDAARPVVVKPLRSQSSTDTYRVDTADHLPPDLVPTAERPFVVEELLVGRDSAPFGDYVSVESVVTDGAPRRIGVTGKFPLVAPFREQGQFVPSQLPDSEQAEITDVAHRAIVALEVERGLVHTELKLTPSGPRIIEVNGRMGGYLVDLYGRAGQVPMVRLGLAAACGLPTPDRLAMPWDGVQFQFWNMPPPAGGRLTAVHGADLVAGCPGVLGYEPRVPVGTDLPPGVKTSLLDMLLGSAPDHATMLDVLDRARDELRFELVTPGTAGPGGWRPTREGLRETPGDAR